MTPDRGALGSRDRFEDEPGADIMSQSWLPPRSRSASLYIKGLSVCEAPEHQLTFLSLAIPSWALSHEKYLFSMTLPVSYFSLRSSMAWLNGIWTPPSWNKQTNKKGKNPQPDSASKHPMDREVSLPVYKKRKAGDQVISGVWVCTGKWCSSARR